MRGLREFRGYPPTFLRVHPHRNLSRIFKNLRNEDVHLVTMNGDMLTVEPNGILVLNCINAAPMLAGLLFFANSACNFANRFVFVALLFCLVSRTAFLKIETLTVAERQNSITFCLLLIQPRPNFPYQEAKKIYEERKAK